MDEICLYSFKTRIFVYRVGNVQDTRVQWWVKHGHGPGGAYSLVTKWNYQIATNKIYETQTDRSLTSGAQSNSVYTQTAVTARQAT